MTIEERLAKLERITRYQRLALVVGAIAVSSFALVAAAQPDTPTTVRGLNVVNAKGELVGFFGEVGGKVKLNVMDPVKEKRAVTIEVGGGAVGITAQDGDKRATVLVTPQGSPGFITSDKGAAFWQSPAK